MKSAARSRVRMLTLGSLLLLALAVPFYSFAATANVVVKPSAMNGWYFWNDAADTFAGSPGAMVNGPAGQPLGAGSARLGPLTSASGASSQSVLATDGYAGVSLSDLSSIDYWTYQPGPVQAVSIQFDVQYRPTDTSYGGRLVYEPYQNGAVVVGSGWQHWTGLLSGKWWATKTTTAGTGGTQVVPLPSGNCGQSTPCTWTQILNAFPSARIAGKFALKSGSNWSGFDGNVDAVHVVVGGGSPTDKTYDFEPETQCTSDCYVDAVNGNNAFGGSTPSSAKQTIQAAVDQVAPNGTVHVAAGTYLEAVTINKDDLTIDGAGTGSTILQSPSVCTVAAGPTGIALTGNRTDITIKDLSITGYRFGMTTGNIGNSVSDITVQNVNSSSNCAQGIWFQAGTTTNVMFDTVTASNNGLAGSSGRGLWLINGSKNDVTVKNGTFNNNNLVGIDFSDGNATGATITGNVVVGNGDSGIALLGAEGPDANLVDGNTVTNNGRFGIEIKGPGGNGAASGPGSVVVSNNVVSRNVAATDARDYAGILVIQRLSGNAGVDALLPAGQPTGVVITGNAVSGYQRKPVGSTGDGFGIVVEGTNQTVDHNIVSGNDVGIQAQAGNPSINAQNTPYFDRGNAASFGGTINRNSISGNGMGFRAVGLSSAADATCNWWGDATGPGPVGPGSGDTISPNATFSPWLVSGTLSSSCFTPPTVDSAASDTSGNEGDTLSSSGSFTGVGVTISANNTQGTFADNGGGSWSWSFATTDDVASTAVTVTATDAYGNTATDDFTYSAANVAPVGIFNAPATVLPTNTFNLSISSPFDPSSADTTFGFMYAFDCGTGFGSYSSSASVTCPALPSGTYSVGGKIRDKDGGVTPYTQPLVVSGGSQAKQDVIAVLQSLLPTGDKKMDERIQKAIDRLQKSLTPTWWTGALTLDPKSGKHVFDEEKGVVDELSKKELQNNPVAQGLIATIVSVDRQLAQYAIDNALSPKPGDLTKANDEMAKGDAATKPQDAIEHYKNAWDKITPNH